MSSLRLYIVPSKICWVKASFWAKFKMAAVFIGKNKNLYISQNILNSQVWLLYKYVFGVKESISGVNFQIWPNLREMGVKNTLFLGQNGQNWEYFKIWLKILRKVLHNKHANLAWADIHYIYIVSFQLLFLMKLQLFRLCK